MSTSLPNSPWDLFLASLAADPEWAHSFVARNFLLEERSMAERWRSYDKFDGRTGHAGYAPWARAHEAYLRETVFRPPHSGTLPGVIDDSDFDRCPESFRESPVFFPYDRDLDLIRVEEVRSLARFVRRSDAEVSVVAQEWIRNPAADSPWHDLLAERNRQTQIRPTFAALYEDVEDILNSGTDWESRLRDALGLLHLDPAERGGGPIPILVFRYPINAVPKLRSLTVDRRPICAPTVLDMTFSPAFCPAPSGTDTGFVIDLTGDTPGTRREVIHPTAPWKASHLWRTGSISRAVARANIPTARALHIDAIRTASLRPDFADKTDKDLL